MSTTIFEENWRPLSIDEQAQLDSIEGKYFINEPSSNLKPKKLARYSFVENLININDPDVLLGYKQISSVPEADSNNNLTGYISVIPGENYEIKGGTYGISAICYFDRDLEYISASSISGTNLVFTIPSESYYIRLSVIKQDWGIISLIRSLYFDRSHKGITPLNIIDNKEGEVIYKDLRLEVFVKAEAIIKDFVHNFNLKDFLDFPFFGNNLKFYTKTQSYYASAYTWPSRDGWVAGRLYSVGNTMYRSLDELGIKKEYYICTHEHTSAESWNSQVTIEGNTYYEYQLWTKLDDEESLYISKPIKESNYQASVGYPYLTELIFKNIWGCDMLNYLNVYVKNMYLAICYDRYFAFNLRKDDFEYNKYYERGYFVSEIEKGVRLLFGESFENDELLGKNKSNNYFLVSENVHNIPEGWDSTQDEVLQNIFGIEGSYPNNIPFDHYYNYSPKIGLPFFKEKSFNDSSIRLTLEKNDVLGNIYRRIINLPILLTFTNNLIKVYYVGSAPEGKYLKQYLNSNDEHEYGISIPTRESVVSMKSTIWCPDVTRLSISSTIVGLGNVTEKPQLVSSRTDVEELSGQTCNLTWKFEGGAMEVGNYMRAVHILEYSDGSNYDKFIFIEKITRTA